MMNTDFLPTNEYYQELLALEDEAARRARYIELFVEPWQAMMAMMGGAHPGGEAPPDALAGARAWNWLLPHQTDEIRDLLGRLEAADAWGAGRAALAEAGARFGPFAGRLPFAAVSGWLMLADPARPNPFERGYTGAIDWTQPRFVGQFWDPNDDNLPRLAGLVAHEMHHLVRLNVFPWNMQTTRVADYIVLEGTAEAFAASLFGEDKVGYFITEFDPGEFETARQVLGQALQRTGFNTIRAYIFGDALAERGGFEPVGMPTYGGYTIGYHVVRAYLARSGALIEEATFMPADEIIEASGFFS